MSNADLFRVWLRNVRAESGLSQQHVAEALKAEGFSVRQTTITKIELGNRPVYLDEAAALVRLFGTTLDVALGLKADSPVSLASRQLAGRTALLRQVRRLIDAELGGAE